MKYVTTYCVRFHGSRQIRLMHDDVLLIKFTTTPHSHALFPRTRWVRVNGPLVVKLISKTSSCIIFLGSGLQTVNDQCDGNLGDMFLIILLRVFSRWQRVKGSKRSFLKKNSHTWKKEGSVESEQDEKVVRRCSRRAH